MNIITHFLASWSLAEVLNFKERDKNLISIASILPDLDGFGIFPDLFFRILKKGDLAYFGTYHHNLFHGIFGSLLFSLIFMFFSKKKLKFFIFSNFLIHLHFFFDLIGARGPSHDEIWPINYLAPFSNSLQIEWKYQWALNDIRNIFFTILLILFVFYKTIKYGDSPVSVFSKKANEAFVNILRKWSKKAKIF